MNNTQAVTIERAGAMPAATWHFLKMNDAVVEIPEGLAIAPDVKVAEPWTARAAADEFENALADAQVEWERAHPAPTAAELAEHAEFLAAEADATYGGTAQSAYQVEADAIEEARSLAVAFEHGMGDEAAAYLRYVAGERIVVEADPGQDVAAEVVVAAVPDAISVAAIDVIADTGSTVRLSIVVDGGGRAKGTGVFARCPEPLHESEEPPSQGAKTPVSFARSGITGTTVRVFADRDALVEIERVQTLPDCYADIDDMGLFAAENARVNVRQTVLGASRSFTGLAGDLRGESSRIDVDTRYLGCGSQERDFNYALRHHGAKARCNLQANGVLAGASSKTLRGTIDLVRGCKGAEGAENETVLLVDEDVHNKTVPVILCNEDDVAGNHGATIGHIRDEQLFYLASRGLSQEEAERMFIGALVEQAAIDAASAAAREGVVRLGERLSPGFAELFEGGAI